MYIHILFTYKYICPILLCIFYLVYAYLLTFRNYKDQLVKLDYEHHYILKASDDFTVQPLTIFKLSPVYFYVRVGAKYFYPSHGGTTTWGDKY
jgi:hypothetical protein